MFARYPSKSETEPSGHQAGPSGGAGGHQAGTWRRLPDLSTRLTPIHLVKKETNHFEKEQKYLVSNLYV